MKFLRHLMAGVLATLTVLLAPTALAQAGSQPRVEAFDLEQVPALTPGTELRFSLYGTPGCSALLRIEGAQRGLILGETDPGIYEGSYTIADFDALRPDSRVTASLQLRERVASAVLEEPLVLGTPAVARRSQPVPPADARAAADPADCSDCGVVEAVRVIEDKGSGGSVGTLAGGVLGAIVGSQVGRGDGRTAATILGALGGAYAGREFERQGRRRTHYEVVVRLPQGGMQTSSYDAPPPFRVGDRVRLAAGGSLRRF
ncbi:MAG TPA: glycine zipper 2TM domain-containing protein [Albitalea sp.]|uniref:glycine zipper 2TM domain-containing protein n=1 Tax=Piscinibacter sp. TaxID=1903157 RepID=UPI002ECFF2DA